MPKKASSLGTVTGDILVYSFSINNLIAAGTLHVRKTPYKLASWSFVIHKPLFRYFENEQYCTESVFISLF